MPLLPLRVCCILQALFDECARFTWTDVPMDEYGYTFSPYLRAVNQLKQPAFEIRALFFVNAVFSNGFQHETCRGDPLQKEDFLNKVSIHAKAGNGGNGAASFKRESTFQKVTQMADTRATLWSCVPTPIFPRCLSSSTRKSSSLGTVRTVGPKTNRKKRWRPYHRCPVRYRCGRCQKQWDNHRSQQTRHNSLRCAKQISIPYRDTQTGYYKIYKYFKPV